MKKATRKSTIKKDAQLTGGFATPTREEKLAFLDLCKELFGPPPERPPGVEEEDAESLIAFFREFVEQATLAKPRNVREIQGFLGHLRPFARLQGKAGADQAKGEEVGGVDFTDAPLAKKKEFLRDLSRSRWYCFLEKSHDDEAAVDRHITMLAQLPLLTHRYPKTLDELADFFLSAAAWTERLNPDIEAQFDRLIDQLPDMKTTVTEEEGEQLIRKFFEQALAGWHEKLDAQYSDLETTLEDVNDPKTVGSLAGSVMDQAFKDLPHEFVQVIQHVVQEAVDAKLDKIYPQIAQLLAEQDKLEEDHDLLAEFRAANQERAQFEKRIQDQLAELMATGQKRADFGEVPPMPTVDETSPSKKEYTTDRERITVTVDPVLFDLYHQERKARGVTASRMQDIILWQRYNKPKLSFEIKLDEAPLSVPTQEGAEERKQKGKRSAKKK